jgi:hypothetical protein
VTRQGPPKVQPVAAARRRAFADLPDAARQVQAPTLTWSRAYRLAWIADSLAVYGFINRDHLQRKFGISRPQASADLTLFARLYPRLVRYNPSAKRYESRRPLR